MFLMKYKIQLNFGPRDFWLAHGPARTNLDRRKKMSHKITLKASSIRKYLLLVVNQTKYGIFGCFYRMLTPMSFCVMFLLFCVTICLWVDFTFTFQEFNVKKLKTLSFCMCKIDHLEQDRDLFSRSNFLHQIWSGRKLQEFPFDLQRFQLL